MVRTIDLPDLGAVSDTSSIVADKAGSGRFGAPAVAAYVAAKGAIVSVKSYGAVGDGVTDDTAAVTAAFNAVRTVGGSLYFPAGKYALAANIPVTLGANASVGVFGAGQEITQLVWASGGGLALTLPSETNSVHIRDMTFATGADNAGTGLAITLSLTSLSRPAYPAPPPSDITNVTFRGTDGMMRTHHWHTCIAVDRLSWISFINVMMAGYQDPSGYSTDSSIGVSLVATSNVPGVVYNFDGCSVNNTGVGLSYGNWVQGVALVNTNFTGCAIGINEPAASGEAQLSVANSQFNCVTGINLLSQVFDVQITSSLFIVPLAGVAIQTAGDAQLTIVGNSFGPSAIGQATGQGIVVNAGPQLGGIVVGNTFWDLPHDCVLLAAGSGGVLVNSNTFVSCQTPVTDAGTGNVITNNLGVPSIGTVPTVGASPWAYKTGSRPESLSLSASTALQMVDIGGVFILASGAPANTPVSVYVPPNTTINVAYTGTLTARGVRI